MSSYATGGAETRVNTYTASLQEQASIATLADGGWIVTWDSYAVDSPEGYGIVQQRYDASGNPVGDETLVNTYVYSTQGVPSAIGLADGGWVVTWFSYQDGDSTGVYQQRFGADGNAVGDETLVNTYTASSQFIPSATALTDGGWVVTWPSYGQDGDQNGIYQQRYDADGNAMGGEVHVSTTSANTQQDVSVTALADGGWVVTWDSLGQDNADGSWGIYQQRYDGGGNALGGETQVNTFTTGSQSESIVAALADGGWVVTWMSFGQTSASGYGIYQQRYSADGARDGGETLVSDAMQNGYQPSLTGLADGGWLVTWTGLSGGIYQQRYDASGHAVGGDTQVNLSAGGTDATVAALPDGGWVVSWQASDGDSSGIYQRHFAPDVIGTAHAESLVGSSWDETLIGYGGNDTLNGGAGDDILIGGMGNDTYIVDSAGDDVQEMTNQGTDTVKASVTYSIANDAVETLILTGTGTINGTGNALANTITGNARNNTLNAAGGNDTVDGGSGNDILNGGGGNDVLTGGLGNDTLNGQVGFDTASYAAAGANVTVNLSTAGAQITGAGTDTLISVENLIGSAHDDTLTGSGGANVVEGGAGNDTINGGAGSDTASYAGAGAGVTVSLSVVGAQNTIGAGSDTMTAMENLIGSTHNDTLTGNTVANVIEGGAGNDVINGGTGIDTASFASASAGVKVNLALAAAQDTVGAGTDTLTSMENLTGSNFADTLTGNAGVNALNGGVGNDTLVGGGGADRLTGGTGIDHFTGGTGADKFIFERGDTGTSKGSADTINDFLTSQNDKIDLHLIDAQTAAAGNQAFTFIGTGAYSNTAGELRYEQGATDTWIYGDTNGDGQNDFVIHLIGALPLLSTDFVL